MLYDKVSHMLCPNSYWLPPIYSSHQFTDDYYSKQNQLHNYIGINFDCHAAFEYSQLLIYNLLKPSSVLVASFASELRLHSGATLAPLVLYKTL